MTKKEFIDYLKKMKSEQMARFEEENIENDKKILFDIRYSDMSEASKEMIILDGGLYEIADFIEKPSELFKKLMIKKGKGEYIINSLSEENKKQLLSESEKAAEFKLLDDPSDEIIELALKKDFKNFKYIIDPTPEQRRLGLNISGKVIKYIDEPTEEEQLIAIENSEKGETIKYIERPTKNVVDKALERDIENMLYISELYFTN